MNVKSINQNKYYQTVTIGLVSLLLSMSSIYIFGSGLAIAAPGSVSNIQSSRSAGSLTVSWTAATGATSYHVVYSTDNANSWNLADISHGSTSYSLGNVDDDATYIIGVRGYDGSNYGPWTDSSPIQPVSGGAQIAAVTTPGSVSNVQASRSGSSVTVSWTAGTNATGYHVVYSTDNRVSWNLVNINYTSTSYTLNNTSNDSSYVFGIRSRNGTGNNVAYSSWVNSSLVPATSHTLDNIGYIGIQSAGRGNTTLPIFWYKKNNSSSVVYDIVYSKDNKSSWTRFLTGTSGTACTTNQIKGHKTTGAVCTTITGLENNKSYVVAVRARYGQNSSPWRNSSAFHPADEPVVRLEQVGCSSSNHYILYAYWGRVDHNYSYEIQYKIGREDWVEYNSSQEPSFNKLVLGSRYVYINLLDAIVHSPTAYTVSFKVRSVKTINNLTVYSPWDTASIQAGTASNTNRVSTRCPAAPTRLTSTVQSTPSPTIVNVDVDWSDSTWQFVEFDLTYSTDNGATWTNVYDLDSSEYTINNLSKTGSVQIKVRARYLTTSFASDWTTATVDLSS